MKRYSFLILSLLLITSISKGQDNSMFYHMNNMPQTNQLNPAKVNDQSKVIVTIPGLSRYNIGYTNSFAVTDLVENIDRTLVIDLDKFQSSLPEKSSFTQSFSTPLLGVQIRKEDKVFSFSVSENERMSLGFDKNLIGLLSKGNNPYVGQTLNMDFGVDLLYYRDFSFGYTQDIIEGLTVGGKLKMLTGIANVNTARSTLSFTTDENLEYIEVGMDGEYNMSLPISVSNDAEGFEDMINDDGLNDIGGFIGNFSNLGFAADLGVNYVTPVEGLSASLSLVDLGLIGWKSNISNVKTGSSFKWEGIDIGNALDENSPTYESFDDQIANITDNAIDQLAFEATDANYSTGIPTRLYIGAEYVVNEMFSAGLVDRIMFYNGNTTNALTLSANAYFFDVISLTAAYSIIGNSYNNLGIGTAFKLGPVQLFFVTDNILALTNPLTAKHTNMSLGLNFMFGKK